MSDRSDLAAYINQQYALSILLGLDINHTYIRCTDLNTIPMWFTTLGKIILRKVDTPRHLSIPSTITDTVILKMSPEDIENLRSTVFAALEGDMVPLEMYFMAHGGV